MGVTSNGGGDKKIYGMSNCRLVAVVSYWFLNRKIHVSIKNFNSHSVMTCTKSFLNYFLIIILRRSKMRKKNFFNILFSLKVFNTHCL